MHYQIAFATEQARLLIGAFAGLFLLAIYGSWLPRAVRIFRNLSAVSEAPMVISIAVAVMPLLIGIGPLLILIALIRNPTTYVTESGISKESAFSPASMRIGWSDIAHMDCRTTRSGKVSTIFIIATDGRRIGFRNTSADFAPARAHLAERLGWPKVPRECVG
jgi:hypothetical protein